MLQAEIPERARRALVLPGRRLGDNARLLIPHGRLVGVQGETQALPGSLLEACLAKAGNLVDQRADAGLGIQPPGGCLPAGVEVLNLRADRRHRQGDHERQTPETGTM